MPTVFARKIPIFAWFGTAENTVAEQVETTELPTVGMKPWMGRVWGMKNPYPSTRRLSVLRITPELIASFCRGRYEIVDTFVPESATVLSTQIDQYDQCIEILLEHGSFADVEKGGEVPEVPPIRVNRIYPNDLGNQIADRAVVTLNEALEYDPACMSALMCVRRICNEGLADHRHIIAWEREGHYSLGLLGLLNGIVSATGATKRVAAVVDNDSDQNVLRFEARDESEFNSKG